LANKKRLQQPLPIVTGAPLPLDFLLSQRIPMSNRPHKRKQRKKRTNGCLAVKCIVYHTIEVVHENPPRLFIISPIDELYNSETFFVK
jgi:hypothetical protein